MINIKPIIGIVGRLYSGDVNIICIEEIRLAVTKFGGIPLLILPINKKEKSFKEKYNQEESKDLENILNICSGFILPGGDTWYPLDEIVIDYAIRKDKPLLAICLGMQALSKVISKGKETYYDNTIKNSTFINHYLPNEDYVHEIIINKNSKLFSIIEKTKIKVNSRHKYHVPLMKTNYISARSSDGIIEGVELKTKKFIIGVQWHPESNLSRDLNSIKIFKSFFANFKNSQKFH